MPRYFMFFFLVFHQAEVILEAFLHSVHCLAYILFPTVFAGYAVYQVVAGTIYFFSGGVGETCGLRGYCPGLIQTGAIPTSGFFTTLLLGHGTRLSNVVSTVIIGVQWW